MNSDIKEHNEIPQDEHELRLDIKREQLRRVKEKLGKFEHLFTSDTEIDSYDWMVIYQLVDYFESQQWPTDEQVNGLIRAFWRRIDMYKNDFEKELPEKMPIQLKAAMLTALLVLNIRIDD